MNTVPGVAVSILIVTYRAGDRLARCLKALLPEIEGRNAQVVVVANGLQAQASLAADCPSWVEVVASPFNLGFAGGLVLGGSVARGEFLVILQDDVRVQSGWLEPLIEDLVEDPLLGGVGSRIDDLDGKPLAAGWVLGPTEPVVSRATEVTLRGPRDRPQPVECLNSASLAVRRAAWDQCGGPDRRLFPVQFVDFDLCIGLLAGGWKLALDLRSVAQHEQAVSLSGQRKEFLTWRNRRRWWASWGRDLERLAPHSEKHGEQIDLGLGRAARTPHPLKGARPRKGLRGPSSLATLVRQARVQTIGFWLGFLVLWPAVLSYEWLAEQLARPGGGSAPNDVAP